MMGIKPISVALNVPSGEVVISGSNFFWEFGFEKGTPRWPQLKRTRNTLQAREKEKMESFAKEKLLWGAIQNGYFYLSQNTNECKINCVPGEITTPQKKLLTVEASYFIADKHEFERHGGSVNDKFTTLKPLVLHVEPGRYVLTHYYGFNNQNNSQSLYAFLTKSNEIIKNETLPEEKLEDILDSSLPDKKDHSIHQILNGEQYSVTIDFDEPYPECQKSFSITRSEIETLTKQSLLKRVYRREYAVE